MQELAGAPTVWIDDEHPIFRRGLGACLRSGGFRVVGESSGLFPQPCLAGLNLLLFEAIGTVLQRAVRLVESTGTQLVAVMPSAGEAELADAVEAGVAAILVRSDLDGPTLVGTLRTVVSGNTSLPVPILHALLERASNGARQTSGGLSERELRVLRLLAAGEDTKQIAVALNYSERTVKNVVHDLLMRMNCRNRAHAVALATRQGVI